ncbi:MAG TPA: cytochrome c3 family protein [Candidatus Eisenbacteria bacterium]|nr:cytochrome c3 family protein [Candidatus Eisenbacteria bacterium]
MRIAPYVVAALVLVAGAGFMVHRLAVEVTTPVDPPRVAYTTSRSCVLCHPGRYETWHRTFHRTMTQPATRATVLGDFENASLTYQGSTSRFTRDGDRFTIECLSPAGVMERNPVVMTVGSRRVQQYVTRIGDRHVRLPLAWNIEERRWVHLNGAFLHPDGSDFNTHRADWDNNCIFCHNVKGQPRYDEATGTFDARVAEMGIACEACHGPADLHVRRNADPLRRYLLYLGGRDPTVLSPREMTATRQVELCGHCHGQRLPNPPARLAEFLMVGDPYTAGEDLGEFTTPIAAHTELPGLDLSVRFWKDGTPRLTAYEYQGLLLSKEHAGTDLTCVSCHSMHGGDPRGMIRPAMRGPEGCLQCHEAIGRDVETHTHHDPQGTGSDCYACHMPPTTYGLLAVHPSHRITNPDPSRAWRYDMPEACTLCHTDRSAAWAARAARDHYGPGVSAEPPAGAAPAVAENVRALLGGDVVQRAVAVEALTAERSYTADATARLWAVPFLLLTMEDRYPAVRHFAYRGLVSLCRRAADRDPGVRPALALPAYDYLAEPGTRAASLAAWWSWWGALDKRRIPHPGPEVPLGPDLMPVRSRIAALTRDADHETIAIGE